MEPLLLIDVQDAYITDKETLNAIHNLCDQHAPTYATYYQNTPTSSVTQHLDHNKAHDPTLDATVKKAATATYGRTAYNALQNDALRKEIQQFDRLHVAGFETEACVLTTAHALFDAGTIPIVNVDACGSADTDCHNAAVKILRRTIGDQHLHRSDEYNPK